MQIRFARATADDAAALATLHTTANADLTARFGVGPWSRASTERGVLSTMRRAMVVAAHLRNDVVGTFALQTQKPWAIDLSYFSRVEKPLYLTSMAVDPKHQRKGIGRSLIEEARRVASAWLGDAIFLDAWDADAGAGEFYRKCGFRETGRAIYKTAPLIYFEMLLR